MLEEARQLEREAAVTLCSQPGSTGECAAARLAFLIAAWDPSLWDGTGHRGRKMSKASLLHARHCATPATAVAKKRTFFSPGLERKKDGRREVERLCEAQANEADIRMGPDRRK